MAGRFRILFAAVVAAGLAAMTPVAAHHSAAAAYDETKKVEAQGKVTRVLVKNPHSWVFLEGTDAKGEKVEWQIEMGGVTSMAWTKEALPVGAAVKAVGHPSRAPGSHGMTAAVFSKADGTPIGPRGGRGDVPPR
jgi:Family of unknown function (DUF6152)